MAPENWKTTHGIWNSIAKFQDDRYGNATGRVLRLLKLSEEIGEATEAYLGAMGANERKGNSHSREEIAKELCDVIITAMVAMEDYVVFPETFFAEHIERVRERVQRDGS